MGAEFRLQKIRGCRMKKIFFWNEVQRLKEQELSLEQINKEFSD